MLAGIASSQEVQLGMSAAEARARLQTMVKLIDSSMTGQIIRYVKSYQSTYIKRFGMDGSISVDFGVKDSVTSVTYLFKRCSREDYLIVVDSINKYYNKSNKGISPTGAAMTGWTVGDTTRVLALNLSDMMMNYFKKAPETPDTKVPSAK